MATRIALPEARHSIFATASSRRGAHDRMNSTVVRHGGMFEYIQERLQAIGAEYDRPVIVEEGGLNRYSGEIEEVVEKLSPFHPFVHAAHLFANAGGAPFALSIPLSTRGGIDKVFWTRDDQMPVARGLIELYIECWQVMDMLWSVLERADAVLFDTTRSLDDRYEAYALWYMLMQEGRTLTADYTGYSRSSAPLKARVRQEIERVRGRVSPPDTDLPAVKGWLSDHLRHRLQERMVWLTDGTGHPRNTAQQQCAMYMAADVQNGLRLIRAAATAANARAHYTRAKAELDAQGVSGAPAFWRTNGARLAPNAEGRRVVSIAPTVKAVRLRVQNGAANQGYIELDAGHSTAEVTQSIGATANDRATLRCDFTSTDPLTAGDHHVHVSVRNDIGPAEIDLVVRVADTAPSFASARRGGTTFTVGVEGRFRFGKATGGNGPLVYSMDAVPDGMAFDPETRTLSGAPSAAAAATDYECTVTDADGDEATQAVSITVASRPPSGGSGLLSRS